MVDKFCGTLYPNINPMSNQCDSRSNKYNIVTIEISNTCTMEGG